MKETKILIAEDHAIVASGIKALLLADDVFDVVQVVENGEEVLSFLSSNHVDVILMDINMPKMNGIECTKRVKEQFPNVKVIVLTMYNRKHFIRELLEIGADGCVLKSNTGKELLAALERISSGKSYFDHVHEFIDHKRELSQYKLSDREIEVIVHISEGLTSKEIANRLYISEHTVKTHRKNIFRKLDIRDSDGLILFAMNEGII